MRIEERKKFYKIEDKTMWKNITRYNLEYVRGDWIRKIEIKKNKCLER